MAYPTQGRLALAWGVEELPEAVTQPSLPRSLSFVRAADTE